MRAAEDSRQAALVELKRQVRLGIRAFSQGIQGLALALGRVPSSSVLNEI